MKILFICKSNFGRSQIAETIFNSLTQKHHAVSAGVEKGRTTGHKLKDFPEHHNLFICMDEIGFDIRENIAKFIDPKTLTNVDIIISMVDKLLLPTYIDGLNKVTFWDVEDMCGLSLIEYRKTRDRIKDHVRKLLYEIDRP